MSLGVRWCSFSLRKLLLLFTIVALFLAWLGWKANVVRMQRQASGYFRAKLAQENLIKSSGIPYTIVRATQFFEFVGSIAEEAADGDSARVSPAMMQPIAAGDVAALVAEFAVGKPLNATIDIAGPEPIRMDDLVRQYLIANRDPRKVVTDPSAGYFGTAVDDESLTPGAKVRLGAVRFGEWLRRTWP